MQLKFDTAMFLSRSEVYDLKPFGSLSLRLLTLAQIGGFDNAEPGGGRTPMQLLPPDSTNEQLARGIANAMLDDAHSWGNIVTVVASMAVRGVRQCHWLITGKDDMLGVTHTYTLDPSFLESIAEWLPTKASANFAQDPPSEVYIHQYDYVKDLKFPAHRETMLHYNGCAICDDTASTTIEAQWTTDQEAWQLRKPTSSDHQLRYTIQMDDERAQQLGVGAYIWDSHDWQQGFMNHILSESNSVPPPRLQPLAQTTREHRWSQVMQAAYRTASTRVLRNLLLQASESRQPQNTRSRGRPNSSNNIRRVTATSDDEDEGAAQPEPPPEQDNDPEDADHTDEVSISTSALDPMSTSVFDPTSTSIFDSISASAFDSISASAFDSISASAFDSIGASAFDSISASAFDSISASAFDSISASVFDSISTFVFGSISASAIESISASVFDSISASAFYSTCGSISTSVVDSISASVFDSSTS